MSDPEITADMVRAARTVRLSLIHENPDHYNNDVYQVMHAARPSPWKEILEKELPTDRRILLSDENFHDIEAHQLEEYDGVLFIDDIPLASSFYRLWMDIPTGRPS